MRFKKLKLVYIIHLLLLFVCISTIIYAFNQITERLDVSGDKLSFHLAFFSVSYNRLFIHIIAYLLVALSVIFKSKLSWFIIISYFYWLIINSFVVFSSDINYELISIDLYYLLLFLIVITISMISIFVFNKEKTFWMLYNINKKSLFQLNLLASILAGVISFLIMVCGNTRYHDLF